jgi:dTDP-4-dehydrorhamnose 3,5-epimerase-like enzyme
MAYLIYLPTHQDKRGNLTVVEKVLPFEIKRSYYIYNVNSKRGGHRHIKTIQALICINGSCDIYADNGKEKETFTLDRPDKCLIVNPEDWHTMDNFSKDSILFVFASEYYNIEDYIDEGYE